MNKMTEKLKLNIQFFAAPNMTPQDFNPDHVQMHEMMDGTLLNNFNEPILRDVLQNSKIMQLGKAVEMDGKSEKKFTYWADKPGAYWVGEGQKIKTTEATTIEATMRAYKLGVILVASREYLKYTYSKFFTTMRPQIQEAFYKKFDEAGILNIENPFAQSVAQAAAKTEGNVITGDITLDNVLKLEDALLAYDVEPNGFISKNQNKTALRGVVDEVTKERYYTKNGDVETLDGLPVVNLKSSEIKKGEIYAGDFDKMFYGVPYPMSYEISTQGQLSTITNPDGTPVNLFEQELIAIRFTMDVAFHIAQEEAFAKLAPTVVA